MSKGFNISLSGLQPVLSKLKQTQNEIINDIDLVISESTQEMALTAKTNAPKDMGRMAGAIGSEKVETLTYDVFCNVMYAPYVEFGTKQYVSVPGELQSYASQFKGKKGKGSYKDLEKNIIAWVKRKGIAPTAIKVAKTGRVTKNRSGQQKNDERLGKFLAWIIATKGIKPQPFFFPAIKQHRRQMIDKIIKIIREKRK